MSTETTLATQALQWTSHQHNHVGPSRFGNKSRPPSPRRSTSYRRSPQRPAQHLSKFFYLYYVKNSPTCGFYCLAQPAAAAGDLLPPPPAGRGRRRRRRWCGGGLLLPFFSPRSCCPPALLTADCCSPRWYVSVQSRESPPPPRGASTCTCIPTLR